MWWVLVNGPPQCGKDTLVKGLTPYIEFKHIKVSMPLKRMLAAMLDVTVEWIEENKDTELPDLHNITVRQALISLSEDHMKERYGEDILGKLAWRHSRASPQKLFITSDSGFGVETRTIVQRASRHNCIAIRVHREGCTFEGDSRSYLPDGICRTYDLYNDKSREQLSLFALRLIARHFAVKFLREPEWVKL